MKVIVFVPFCSVPGQPLDSLASSVVYAFSHVALDCPFRSVEYLGVADTAKFALWERSCLVYGLDRVCGRV